MCNSACVDFAVRYVGEEDVRGKKVLEVGSRNINGSIRNHIEQFNPSKYIGADIFRGPGVDVICDITKLYSLFGKESFDLVICTEVVEHVLDWNAAITNLKRVLRCEGKLLVTTRSKGFPYHGFPFDYWRFELHDFERVFSDMDIVALEKDLVDPGVFVMAAKGSASVGFQGPIRLPLYSMLTRKETSNITRTDRVVGFVRNFHFLGFLSAVLPETLKTRLKKIFRYGLYEEKGHGI